MKKQNTAVNVITAILAAFLSIFLVVMCIVIPVFTSATSITKPKKLVTLVQAIDYKELMTQNTEVESSKEEFGIPAEVMNELISSKAAGEIIKLFAEDVSAALTGKEIEKSSITADTIKKIVNDNIDEITEIVKSASKEELNDKDVKKLKSEILKAVDEGAEDLAKSLPDPKEFITTMEVEGAEVIRTVLSPTITIILIAIALFFAGLIYACRFRNFNALLWLGVDTGLAAIIVTTITVFIGSKLVKGLITDMANINKTVIDSVIKVYTSGLIVGLVVLFLLCAMFVAGYILLKKYVVNKAEENQIEIAEELPEEATEIVEEI